MGVLPSAKRRIDGKIFEIITAHGNKRKAQEYAATRREQGNRVRVLPVTILNKRVHGIWLSRGRERKKKGRRK